MKNFKLLIPVLSLSLIPLVQGCLDWNPACEETHKQSILYEFSTKGFFSMELKFVKGDNCWNCYRTIPVKEACTSSIMTISFAFEYLREWPEHVKPYLTIASETVALSQGMKVGDKTRVVAGAVMPVMKDSWTSDFDIRLGFTVDENHQSEAVISKAIDDNFVKMSMGIEYSRFNN